MKSLIGVQGGTLYRGFSRELFSVGFWVKASEKFQVEPFKKVLAGTKKVFLPEIGQRSMHSSI